MNNTILDAVREEQRKFESALFCLENITYVAEKDFEDMSTLAKRIAAATTMTQEEAIYYLSHKLMESIFNGEDLKIDFDY